jgi:hypothetical protein
MIQESLDEDSSVKDVFLHAIMTVSTGYEHDLSISK